MKKYLEILKKCPLFFDVNEDEIHKMLGCLGPTVESFDKKYTVISEGSYARYIGIVLSGSVQMIKHDYYGNRSIVAEIGPSEMFCDEFACADVSSVPVSFISNEPSEIMLIECQRVLRSCGSSCNHHHRMIFNLMKNLADKNIRFHERIEITSKRTTREKLMAYLIAEAQRIKSTKFEIPFDRQELADYLEVDRSGLSSAIGKLVKEGIIAANKRQFELL